MIRRLPPGVDALESFIEAEVLSASDVHVAAAIGRTIAGTSDSVLLAAALCVRGLRFGHVCIEPATVADTVLTDTDPVPATGDPTNTDPQSVHLEWPEPSTWIEALVASPAVAVCDPTAGKPDSGVLDDRIRPLVFDGTRLYLERYWRYERQVGDALLEASNDHLGLAMSGFDSTSVEAMLDRYLGTEHIADDDPSDSDSGSGSPDVPPSGQPTLPGLGPDAAAGTDPAEGAPRMVENLQRRAARTVLDHRVTVLAGGPGTGKTHTVAHLLAAVQHLASETGEAPEIALAAPTGKAAARMTEAIRAAVVRAEPPESVARPLLELEATTIHRLLGYRDGISFRHDRQDPLPHDLVVIDETSMVALPLMARLLDALRSEASVVLVGDPFQLASVEAGAVLGDVVGPAARTSATSDPPSMPTGPLADSIVVLEQVHRYDRRSGIAALADAVRATDADRVLEVLRDPSTTDVRWVDPADGPALEQLRSAVAEDSAGVMAEARSGDPADALERATALKVLCGTRFGPLGSYAWRDLIEQRIPRIDRSLSTRGKWYLGRPLMVTRNDYITGVFNGDTALVVERDGRPMVATAGSGTTRLLSTSQVDSLETWWAMTIHKSQGSEFDHAIVSLPDSPSRVLTNELLYTGITRGREQVTVVASEESLRTAVDRRISRASGLGERLWPG